MLAALRRAPRPVEAYAGIALLLAALAIPPWLFEITNPAERLLYPAVLCLVVVFARPGLQYGLLGRVLPVAVYGALGLSVVAGLYLESHRVEADRGASQAVTDVLSNQRFAVTRLF